jgi:hypothetical protein
VKPSDVDVRTCGKRTANALCALTRIALGGRTGSTVHAKMTLNLTRRNAKMTRHNAKNNAEITRNNAGACVLRTESGAAYVLYLRELRFRDRVRSEIFKKLLLLVNIRVGWPILAGAAFSGGFWSGLVRSNAVPKRRNSSHRLKPLPPSCLTELHETCPAVPSDAVPPSVFVPPASKFRVAKLESPRLGRAEAGPTSCSII